MSKRNKSSSLFIPNNSDNQIVPDGQNRPESPPPPPKNLAGIGHIERPREAEERDEAALEQEVLELKKKSVELTRREGILRRLMAQHGMQPPTEDNQSKEELQAKQAKMG